MERRVKSIETALSEMQSFIQVSHTASIHILSIVTTNDTKYRILFFKQLYCRFENRHELIQTHKLKKNHTKHNIHTLHKYITMHIITYLMISYQSFKPEILVKR